MTAGGTARRGTAPRTADGGDGAGTRTRTTAIVVVSYGSSALLAQNLVPSAHDADIVVVVDNWTDAAERSVVLALAAEHTWLVETPHANTGFGIGMNIGVRRALREGATSVLLLNPDARISPAVASRLHDQVERDRSLLLAPVITAEDGSAWMRSTFDLNLFDGTMRSTTRRTPGTAAMTWVSGAVMALSADLWEATGGFDEDYFLYWEDVDLCRRVYEAAGRVEVDDSLTAVHAEGGTHADGGGRAKSETFYVYNIRNRALYARKWLGPADRRRWAYQTPRTAIGVLLTGGRRQFLQSVRPWRGLLRGLFAAARVTVTDALPRSSGTWADHSVPPAQKADVR
ncbi:MAG: glycosyltransferase family 2 protein [Cellulomonadaceae bacterium]